MDSEKLIELVRQNHILYDMSHKSYSNTIKKSQLWDKIGEKLNIRGSDCKKTWVGLRDTFRRVVKKRRETRSGQAAVRQKAWKYEEQQAFLEPHMAGRDTKSCLDVTLTPDEDMEDINATQSRDERKIVEAPCSYKKSKTPESASGALMKFLLKEQQENKKLSGMRLFLMSMADSAENFTALNQNKAKAKIFAIISEIELEEMTYEVNNESCHFVGTSENSSPKYLYEFSSNLS